MGFLDFLKGLFKPGKSRFVLKCPNCGSEVSSADERCMKCGMRIKSVIRLKCPRCSTSNPLDNGKCESCGSNIEAKKKNFFYRCHVCGNESGKFFEVCEACGTRMV